MICDKDCFNCKYPDCIATDYSPKKEEYRKQYYQENKEKIAEKSRQYREKNKEIIAECQRRYYERNKRKKAEYQRRYRQEHKEKGKVENPVWEEVHFLKEKG